MGIGHLVSKESYTDFEIRLSLRGTEKNSGVYMRCLDGSKITDKTLLLSQVSTTAPISRTGTGGIPNYAPPSAIVKAEGKGNTLKSPCAAITRRDV